MDINLIELNLKKKFDTEINFFKQIKQIFIFELNKYFFNKLIISKMIIH